MMMMMMMMMMMAMVPYAYQRHTFVLRIATPFLLPSCPSSLRSTSHLIRVPPPNQTKFAASTVCVYV